MSELDLIIDLHKPRTRQGPGSEASTKTALALTGLSVEAPLELADIGCGTGGQTMIIAESTNWEVTAIDLFPAFLTELEGNLQGSDFKARISTVEGDMQNLPFEHESLDVLWSEGAIYNIGFETGIRAWRPFLRKGGCLAVSEITWITNNRPHEIDAYWKHAYPEIDTASNKIKLLEENGYTLAGYFYLPVSDWLDAYYTPLQESFDTFLDTHDHTDLARKVVSEHQEEIDLYIKYSEYYSYGFYVARKN